MQLATKARTVLAGIVLMAALAGTGVAAAPANAANWNIPSNIHYPFFPECNTHMSAYEAGYGTQTCKGEYTVNKSNYMFTQDNHRCTPVRAYPPRGAAPP